MTVDDQGAVGKAPVGHRDHRGRCRQGTADPGHDLHGYAVGPARGDLLPTATEEEAVAALEPHDIASAARLLDQQGVDLVLGGGVGAGSAADIDDLGALWQVVEQPGRQARAGRRRRHRRPSAPGSRAR